MVSKEKLIQLEEMTAKLVKLRMVRDALTARINELETDMNHMIGLDAMKTKMFAELRAVMLMGKSQDD